MLDKVNRAVHQAYNARVESFIHQSGLYPLLYGFYERILGLAYRQNTYTLNLAEDSATYHMVHDAEIVSILHTLEKERDIIQTFTQRLRPEDCVWDIGANLGVYTVAAGSVAGTVVGFEPHPVTAGRARENAALNNYQNVSVQEVGLWDETTTSALSTDRDELGTQTPRVEDDGDLAIDLVRGSDVAAPAPTVLKIDVEGAEEKVLDGFGDRLSSVRLVLLEAHDDCGIDWLRRQGFSMEVIGQHNGERFVLAERNPDAMR